MDFYHCSHSSNFPTGFTFDLFNVVRLPHPFHPDVQIKELNSKYLECYGSGISNHGQNHLEFVTVNDTKKSSYISTKPLMEYLFELVRLKDFPDKPSRFLSYFGCLTLEDALDLKVNTFTSERFIYRVSSENHFLADMNWIHLGSSTLETLVLAEKYWSGSITSNPKMEVLLEAPMTLLERILL